MSLQRWQVKTAEAIMEKLHKELEERILESRERDDEIYNKIFNTLESYLTIEKRRLDIYCTPKQQIREVEVYVRFEPYEDVVKF